MTLVESVLKILKNKPMKTRDLVLLLDFPERDVRATVRYLIDLRVIFPDIDWNLEIL